VSRVALILFLGSSLLVAALSTAAPDEKEPPKKTLTTEDLNKAIADLGGRQFAVRERAKKLLADAGAAAEPFLEEASKSADEEISSSAKAILEKFQWGLYPDTPKEVREQIELFRSGLPDQRQGAIAMLFNQNPIPFPTIHRLLDREENEEQRKLMLASMYQRVRMLILGLLVRGKLAAVEDMFEATRLGSHRGLSIDYAAFMCLNGKLGVAIHRFEEQRKQKGEAGDRAARVLVYLYYNNGDWASARRAALDAKDNFLAERVSLQAGDWKALAADVKSAGDYTWLGLAAAYSRLAGDNDDFDKKIAEIKELGENSTNENTTRRSADELLLNGKSSDAIRILTEKKKTLAHTFVLLCAQMKYKEAFNLADEARRRDADPKERWELEIRRARMHYLLGERDTAIQLFAKTADEIKTNEQFRNIWITHELIQTEAKVGLRDLARDHAAQFMGLFRKRGFTRSATLLLMRPIFGDDANVAQSWLILFERELLNDDPAVAMKRVSDILVGKLNKSKLDECISKIVKDPPEEEGLGSFGRSPQRSRSNGLAAVAAAYKAIGDEKKTEECLRKSVDSFESADRWIVLADFQMDKEKYREAAESYAKAAKFCTERVMDYDWFSVQFGPALPAYLQARALLSAGDVKEGNRLIELAHWLLLGNEISRIYLIEELNKRGWPVMARKEADFLLKDSWHPEHGDWLGFLARQSAKEKDYFKAAKLYEKHLVSRLGPGETFAESAEYLLAPERVRLYCARGYLAKGQIDKAEREANASLEAVPGNIQIAIKLVPDLDKLDKKKEADAIYGNVVNAWENACKDYPNSAFSHNSVAWVMANCRRDLDAALKHAQKAVEVEPKNTAYIGTLAEVHFRKGDRDKAISLIKKCIELDPKRPYYRKQLARFEDQPFDSSTTDADD
jgi:tetratricopeptide (TPR) repeat protein